MGGPPHGAVTNRVARVLLAILPALAVLVSPAARAAEPLRFGVVPQQSASELARMWTPFMAYLAERTGIAVRFETARDIPTFEARLVGGEYDLAYANPRSYIQAHASPARLVAFAKEADTVLTGIIVVHRDSPLRALGELEGQTVAFPAETAFAATIIPREALAAFGVRITPRFVSSHESVYRVVAKRMHVAGGGVERTLATLPPDVRAQLRVLWRSPGFTPHAFAAHARVSKEQVDRLREAMVAMKDDERGQAVLASLGLNPLERAEDRDYDAMRRRLAAVPAGNAP